ncbi:hypothetical protein GOBAR_DD19351 [Gossypium barbadense]|nr:hypothetical protein GOBAR_DD19351 [Gossypium barbadense]
MWLAKKYHPVANKNNPSAKRKFQEITDAYETEILLSFSKAAKGCTKDLQFNAFVTCDSCVTFGSQLEPKQQQSP